MSEQTIKSPELQPHPASGIFPEMPPKDFRSLVDDIQDNGLREPIVLYEGKILDGNHRYRACSELGIEPCTVEYDGDAPMAFVLSSNIHRRHLTASQKAMVAARVEPFHAELAKSRQGARTDLEHGGKNATMFTKARDAVAKAIGVSGRYVSDAKALMASDSELAKQVDSGRLKLSQAKRIVERKTDIESIRSCPPQIRPTETAGRKTKILHNGESGRWMLVVGPNDAGEKLREHLDSIQEEPAGVEQEREIDSLTSRAAELRSEADRLDEAAREKNDDLSRWVSDTAVDRYGPAHPGIETIEFEPVDAVQDEHLKTLDNDALLARLLAGDGVREVERACWGDVALTMHQAAVPPQPTTNPNGWTRMGSTPEWLSEVLARA